MRALTAVACLLLVAASCGGGDDAARSRTASVSASGTTGSSGPQVRIETRRGAVTIDVEVADSPHEWQVGLMNRTSLPPDAGMIFVFPENENAGFWMKNTLIPLSIAFADDQGTILSILDMEPCRADPCKVYDPGVAFRTALEVNQGAFERWGVAEGDRLTFEP